MWWRYSILALTLACEVPEKKEVAPCMEGYVRAPLGCVPVDDSGEAGVGDSGGGWDTGGVDTGGPDTGGPVVWYSLSRTCDRPATMPADPITDLGEFDTLPELVDPSSFLMELVEVVVSDDHQWVFGVGQGGLVAFDVSDPMAPSLVSSMPASGYERYHRVFLFGSDDPGDGLAYLTHRDRGLYVVSVEDRTDMSTITNEPEMGAGGMAQVGDYLYMTLHWGAVAVYDISDRSGPMRVGTGEAGGNPWTLVATEDALYVADATAGLVVMDRTDATAPVEVARLALGGVQDLALGDGMLYAAAGSAGVVALDISDPLAPVQTDQIVFGTNVQGIARDGDALWVADQEGVRVMDISSPSELKAVGSRTTPQWALDIAASGGRAWVGDWGRVGGYSVELPGAAPDLELSMSEVYLDESGDLVTIEMRNLGQASLFLTGATLVIEAALDIAVSHTELAPGQTATLRLEWPGGPMDTTLCLASNDPDESQAEVEVHTGGGGVIGEVGRPAPDFVLTDLDGESHRLSEHLGHPVVLVYFATW